MNTTVTNAHDCCLASRYPRRMYYLRDRAHRAFLVPESAISPELAAEAIKADGAWVLVELPHDHCATASGR